MLGFEYGLLLITGFLSGYFWMENKKIKQENEFIVKDNTELRDDFYRLLAELSAVKEALSKSNIVNFTLASELYGFRYELEELQEYMQKRQQLGLKVNQVCIDKMDTIISNIVVTISKFEKGAL